MKNSDVKLIPVPKKVEGGEDTFDIRSLSIFTKHSEWNDLLEGFRCSFQKIYEHDMKISEDGIELIYDESVRKDGYLLEANCGEIRLIASSNEGASYAFATLLQLITQESSGFTMPSIKIEDYPDKDFRTLMVDLARLWHPASTVYKYIDLCFLYKIKYLHLHFVDDPSYTLPSRAFERISTVGKSYTFEEIASFVSYAKSRGVILIPEIEAPGHATSLNRAYYNIFGNDPISEDEEALVTENGDSISNEAIVCAGKKSVTDALRVLLEEVCEMFPDSPYIHIGGDEANIQSWTTAGTAKNI